MKEVTLNGKNQIEIKPQRKEFRRPIQDILEDLSKPIPDRFISYKMLKGNKIAFVPWYKLNKLLDFYAPGWEWELQTNFDGRQVCIVGKLTVKAKEGDFYRSAVGDENSDLESFGSSWTNAEQQAFRRCCARFGLGLALWEK